jgi:hypothetical protein
MSNFKIDVYTRWQEQFIQSGVDVFDLLASINKEVDLKKIDVSEVENLKSDFSIIDMGEGYGFSLSLNNGGETAEELAFWDDFFYSPKYLSKKLDSNGLTLTTSNLGVINHEDFGVLVKFGIDKLQENLEKRKSDYLTDIGIGTLKKIEQIHLLNSHTQILKGRLSELGIKLESIDNQVKRIVKATFYGLTESLIKSRLTDSQKAESYFLISSALQNASFTSASGFNHERVMNYILINLSDIPSFGQSNLWLRSVYHGFRFITHSKSNYLKTFGMLYTNLKISEDYLNSLLMGTQTKPMISTSIQEIVNHAIEVSNLLNTIDAKNFMLQYGKIKEEKPEFLMLHAEKKRGLKKLIKDEVLRLTKLSDVYSDVTYNSWIDKYDSAESRIKSIKGG